MPRAKAPTRASAETGPVSMTVDELPVQARLRLEHAGRWVAWADDFTRVVAAGDDYVSVREAASQAGVARVVYEWVPPVPIKPLPCEG
jgi:hypothetical protein